MRFVPLESSLTYSVGPDEEDVEMEDAPLSPVDVVPCIWPSVPTGLIPRHRYAILRLAEVDHSNADNRNKIVQYMSVTMLNI
jgi:hypothetical protein